MSHASLSTNNPTVVSAFHSALLHQFLLVVVIGAVLLLGWNLLRARELRRNLSGAVTPPSAALPPEPVARRVVRIGFGLLWLFDGLLQAQASMPLGLPDGVLKPAAAGSPGWVVRLVNDGATIWSNHPVTAAAATVWIQGGIGLFLLVAPRGNWSRLAGGVSVVWGLLVWSFGEAFGSIFAPGLTILFGAPGAALFYCAGGALVALPERAFSDRRLGRAVLGVMGAFFLGMAVLQAWPGRGFWQGHVRTTAGSLTAMVQSMASTPQPGALHSMIAGFASFEASHGFAVNLVAVVVLAAIGLACVSGNRRLAWAGLVLAVVFCLADWVFVEDLGFLGGVGTDPNSMLPIALVLTTGYLALAHAPAATEATEPAPVAAAPLAWRERLSASPGYAFRTMAAAGAVVVVLVGAAPIALASLNSHADPIVAEAFDGTPTAVDSPAPAFHLVDQYGRTVTLASLRGRAIAMTFLDPVCTNDCPVIAQEFRQADVALGSAARKAVFIAVDANPLYTAVADVQAFDRTEHLTGLANWLYLTGPVRTLRQVWDHYGVVVAVEGAGSMVAHSETTYIIDPEGRTRYILDADPGPGTSTSVASTATVIDDELARVGA